VNAFKPHLASVADYPYSKFEARVKLDQNESPDDFPEELKARALERLARLSWNRYPELHGEDVRAAVARHEGWPEEGVVLSPGSNLLVLALAEAAASVVDTAPAFPYYKAAATASATPYRAVPLGDGFALPLAGLLAALDGPPSVLFLPNPHGPTGQLFASADVEALAERARARDALLVVDEAYHAFSGTDALPLARANPNVAVLRTFSKSWCLGGIRAGYLLASPKVAAGARALLPPGSKPAHTGAIRHTPREAPG
jgi:histidinol-phosphate aminotransferase